MKFEPKYDDGIDYNNKTFQTHLLLSPILAKSSLAVK